MFLGIYLVNFSKNYPAHRDEPTIEHPGKARAEAWRFLKQNAYKRTHRYI